MTKSAPDPHSFANKMSKLAQVKAASAKRHGGESQIHSGDSVEQVVRIPFKSIEMNLATWGGAPMGRMIRSWGGKSSCKSMTMWELAKMAQDFRSEQFPTGLCVAYHNIEGAYDPDYVRRVMGLDIREPKLIIAEGGLIEDVGENLRDLLPIAEMHIIDSASFAQSIHGFDAKKGSRQPGFDSQAWKNVYRMAEMEMSKTRNIICIIDQIRTDFHTGAEKAAGGHVADHASSLSLHHRRGKKLYRTPSGKLTDTRPKTGNDEMTGTHRVDGYMVEVEVDKSRVSRPFGKAYMKFDIDELSFDSEFELLKAGVKLGVITLSGSYYKAPTFEKAIQGEDKIIEHLETDGILRAMIWEAAFAYTRENGYA